MSEIVEAATLSVRKSKSSFCKYISANDCGKTGGHQAGFYIPKNSISLMFDAPGIKGENKDRIVTIRWQNDFESQSRFIYYGSGTRNEYRLTRFGRNFPYLKEDDVGNLLILSHIIDDYYEAFVLELDDDIEDFFAAFNLSAQDTNKLIPKSKEIKPEDKLLDCFKNYIDTLNFEFPSTFDLASNARICYLSIFSKSKEYIKADSDEHLLKWLDAEFQLFKAIEIDRYQSILTKNFNSVEELIECANTILNRRKSRAGKSLEHHLAEMFKIHELVFEAQAVTESNKKPDFIFPSAEAYHDRGYNANNLIFLASKTTCKDRWRQILNEADRIKEKHLFTLQQGISKNQLVEMYESNVKLVVPKQYHDSFPKEFRPRILTLTKFMELVKSKEYLQS